MTIYYCFLWTTTCIISVLSNMFHTKAFWICMYSSAPSLWSVWKVMLTSWSCRVGKYRSRRPALFYTTGRRPFFRRGYFHQGQINSFANTHKVIKDISLKKHRKSKKKKLRNSLLNTKMFRSNHPHQSITQYRIIISMVSDRWIWDCIESPG